MHQALKKNKKKINVKFFIEEGAGLNYSPNYQGSILAGAGILLSPLHPDHIWNPFSLLSSGHWMFYTGGKEPSI
jgi:hypothetical protein